MCVTLLYVCDTLLCAWHYDSSWSAARVSRGKSTSWAGFQPQSKSTTREAAGMFKPECLRKGACTKRGKGQFFYGQACVHVCMQCMHISKYIFIACMHAMHAYIEPHIHCMYACNACIYLTTHSLNTKTARLGGNEHHVFVVTFVECIHHFLPLALRCRAVEAFKLNLHLTLC